MPMTCMQSHTIAQFHLLPRRQARANAIVVPRRQAHGARRKGTQVDLHAMNRRAYTCVTHGHAPDNMSQNTSNQKKLKYM